MERLLRRERDRVQQEIELPPFLPDPFEHLLRLALDHDIHWHEDRCLQCLCERLDMLFSPIVQIGDGEIGAKRTKGLGTSPGDRLIVGDADDQALLALQRDLGIGEYGDHDTLSCLALDDGLFNSSDNVCCAIISSSSVGMT